jgi:hypothetical protein
MLRFLIGTSSTLALSQSITPHLVSLGFIFPSCVVDPDPVGYGTFLDRSDPDPK